MSILIKGIDLPKGDTEEVVIRIQPNGEVRDSHGILLDVKAIQIPKGHGKISDISGLLNEYKERLNSLSFVVNIVRREAYRTVLIDICNDLDNAPTILEAEQSEEMEEWNSYSHGKIYAPKGTFQKIIEAEE